MNETTICKMKIFGLSASALGVQFNTAKKKKNACYHVSLQEKFQFSNINISIHFTYL